MEGWQDYQMETRTTYGERDISMDIRKAKDNFDKNRRPKCFNCNVHGHIMRYCKKPKKKWDTWKCYKYKKIRHIAKDCQLEQKMKSYSIQKELDIEKKKFYIFIKLNKWKTATQLLTTTKLLI